MAAFSLEWISKEKSEYELEVFVTWIECILLKASQSDGARDYSTWVFFVLLLVLRLEIEY